MVHTYDSNHKYILKKIIKRCGDIWQFEPGLFKLILLSVIISQNQLLNKIYLCDGIVDGRIPVLEFGGDTDVRDFEKTWNGVVQE